MIENVYLRSTRIPQVVTLSSAVKPELDDLWLTYKKTHGKAYPLGMDFVRREIWEASLDYIRRHNIEADRGQHSYWMGENQFTDMTDDEFRSTMNGYMPFNMSSSNVLFVPTLYTIPKSVDWRAKGYVTSVKDQKGCGSCWAFSATGSIEGQHFKKTRKLVSLSEQNLIDCSKAYGNKGCNGGWMVNAFRYIINNQGIDTEGSYPYEAKENPVCRFKKAGVGATMRSFVEVEEGSERALAEAVAEIGPISVAMDAGHPSFKHYRTGIYTETACSRVRLNHGVLAVGYGSQNGHKYWIMKNRCPYTWKKDSPSPWDFQWKALLPKLCLSVIDLYLYYENGFNENYPISFNLTFQELDEKQTANKTIGEYTRGDRKVARCGRMRSVEEYTICSSVVDLQFRTDDYNVGKGFKLEYQHS